MKKIMLLILGLVSTSYAMEEREAKLDLADPMNMQISNTEIEKLETANSDIFETDQGAFNVLPAEIIEYIFHLLILDAYTKGSTPLEKLTNVLSNKDLANIKCVNKLFKTIASEKGITNTIAKLTNFLVQNNKVHFEGKFIQLCKKETYKQNNNNQACPLDNLFCNSKFQPIDEQIKKQDIKSLKCLLAAEVDLINAKDNDDANGNTALMLTAFYNNKEALELILNYINKFEVNIQLAIINAKNDYGETVLLNACYNNKEALELILSYISKFEMKDQLAIINVRNIYGNTPLILAAKLNIKSLELVLNYISKFEVEDQLAIIKDKNNIGKTALILAAKLNIKSLELILNYISKFEVEDQLAIIKDKNNIGKTPLILAAEDNIKSLELILNYINKFNKSDQAAIINAKNFWNETALMKVAEYSKEALRLMLNYISKFDLKDQLAIINAKNNENRTALDIAQRYGTPQIAALLQEANKKSQPRYCLVS